MSHRRRTPDITQVRLHDMHKFVLGNTGVIGFAGASVSRPPFLCLFVQEGVEQDFLPAGLS